MKKMNKIIATGAAIAFATTLTSCDMMKEVEMKDVEKPVVQNENNNTAMEAAPVTEDPALINPEPTTEDPALTNPEPTTEPANSIEQNPKMKEFEEKQAKMGQLFQEFEKNTPKFKTLQEEINKIFSSGEQPTAEDMKRVEEIDKEIRSLFSPEMTALDKELRELGNEIFGQPAQSEQPATEAAPVEPTTKSNKKPMMILK